MLRKAASLALTTLMILSLLGTTMNIRGILKNPAARFFVEREQNELTAKIEYELARYATPDSISAHISALLQETPRNWLVIEAVGEMAEMRNIPIKADVIAAKDIAYDEDHGILAGSGKCLKCMWDATNCELSAVLLCRAPIDLTPLGDVSGVVLQSTNYMLGRDVDMFDLGLSVLGLGATALVPLTGGSSETIKLGASLIKTARRMGRLSSTLVKSARHTFGRAINWGLIAKSGIRNFGPNLRRVIDAEKMAPLVHLAQNVEDIRRNTSIPETLHFMKLIDTPADARAISRITKAEGKQSVGIIEVLGKNRAIRATMRYSDTFITAGAAFLTALSILSGMVSGILHSLIGWLLKRGLRRLARRKPRAKPA